MYLSKNTLITPVNPTEPSTSRVPSPQDQPLPRVGIAEQIRDFLLDREARGLSKRTIAWYREQLPRFESFLRAHDVAAARDVTSNLLREYIIVLRAEGHNAGGVSNAVRAAKALLNWYAEEDAPPDWKNPTLRVRVPKAADDPLPPADIGVVQAMLATCRRKTFTGDRDRAILMALLDTGCRRSEFVALNLGDVNWQTGAIVVHYGKGQKSRFVFAGAKTRREIANYLKHRPRAGDKDPLWVGREGERLSVEGLRSIIERRAADAGVKPLALHSFRRAFAILSLRAGVDLVSLQRLLGHADLSVVQRYLKQVEEDLQAAHAKASPADRLLAR